MKIKKHANQIVFLGLIIVSLLGVSRSIVSAQISIQPYSESNSCNNSDNNIVTAVLNSLPSSGSIYLRLPPNQISEPITLFLQPFSNNECINLGTVVPSTTSWIKIADLESTFNLTEGAGFIAESVNIGSTQSEKALDMLIAPSQSTCVVTTSCLTSYNGLSGSLNPNVLSGANDQIAVYSANPLSNTSLTTVNYYSNQKLLYSTAKLSQFNRDYLDGGEHHVTIIANFKNGEQLTVNQSINTGTDISGYLWLRSALYNSKNKPLFIINLVAIIVLLCVIILLTLRLHRKRRHRFQQEPASFEKLPTDNMTKNNIGSPKPPSNPD